MMSNENTTNNHNPRRRRDTQRINRRRLAESRDGRNERQPREQQGALSENVNRLSLSQGSDQQHTTGEEGQSTRRSRHQTRGSVQNNRVARYPRQRVTSAAGVQPQRRTPTTVGQERSDIRRMRDNWRRTHPEQRYTRQPDQSVLATRTNQGRRSVNSDFDLPPGLGGVQRAIEQRQETARVERTQQPASERAIRRTIVQRHGIAEESEAYKAFVKSKPSNEKLEITDTLLKNFDISDSKTKMLKKVARDSVDQIKSRNELISKQNRKDFRTAMKMGVSGLRATNVGFNIQPLHKASLEASYNSILGRAGQQQHPLVPLPELAPNITSFL